MENNKKKNSKNHIPDIKVKAYRRRWVILIIYIMYSTANAFQWLEYAIIANVVMKYYDVSPVAVDWTSIVYMIIYPVIVVPVSYIIDTKGLRVAGLIGGIGTALAAAVKSFSIGRDLFYVVIIGQAIGSTAQVFVMCLPAKIAAIWFKPEEASTACSLGAFGTQLGFALGFLIPTYLVSNHDDLDLIGEDLRRLCWFLTYYMIPVVIAIIFFFAKEPPLPPSECQALKRDNKPLTFREYLKYFKKLFYNRGFVLHSIGYGLNLGVFAAVGTLLNQMVLYFFPNSEEDAGRMGLLTSVIGMIASVVFGMILDKTHKYKETSVFVYLSASFSMLAVMFAFNRRSKLLAYIATCILGFFANSYIPIGMELAVEMTYPADESTTAGILNASSQAFGVVVTILLGELNQRFGPTWALSSQVAILIVGSLITMLLPNVKLRQEAICKSRNVKLLDGV